MGGSSNPEEYLSALETELALATDPGVFPLRASRLFPAFVNMQHYHLGWTDASGNRASSDPGKRVRPLLCLLSCEATGADWRKAIPAAAAIELVHNFSLIHDDIEDGSAERRGRLAVWKVWGLAQGLNAGDAMFCLARLELDRLDAPPDVFAEVHRLFDCATLAITQGQYLDLAFEGRTDVTVEDYLEMVGGKTAALLATSAQIGATVAGAPRETAEQFREFGENLGISFQITDDVLGIWGDPAVTGKPAQDDLWSRKKSLPLLAAMQADTSGELGAFLQKEKVKASDVDRAMELLERLGSREQTEELAMRYMERALEALDKTGLDNPAMQRLRALAQGMVGRQK